MMHIFTDEYDWIIAESQEQAMEMHKDMVGGGAESEYWFKMDDDSDLMIWCNERDGLISDGGLLIIGQAMVWIEYEGAGWLCSS